MINDKDVQYIADLARISLKPEEVSGLTNDLEKILGYVAKLEKLNTDNIPPTSHTLTLKNVYREDTIIESLPQEEALKIAIEKKNGSFKVPKVIE